MFVIVLLGLPVYGLMWIVTNDHGLLSNSQPCHSAVNCDFNTTASVSHMGTLKVRLSKDIRWTCVSFTGKLGCPVSEVVLLK